MGHGNKKVKVKCEYCGKDFYRFYCWVKRVKTHYCSKECILKGTATKGEWICENCGKDYKSKADHNAKRRFCSRPCWYQFHIKSTKIKRICKNCGRLFLIPRHYLKGTRKDKGHFCSVECKLEAQGSFVTNCLKCGKPQRRGKARGIYGFCSLACYRRYKGESSIERKFRLELDKRKIKYLQEIQIGRYSVDFIVKNIAIEIDGNYWHNKEGIKERDKRKGMLLKMMGYRVIRFTETEINENVRECADKILAL